MAGAGRRWRFALACLPVALLAAWGAVAWASVHGPPGALRRPVARAHAAVIGGRTAAPAAVPWLVFVQVNPTAHRGGDACTGTVMSASTVLTAAHCVTSHLTGSVYSASRVVVANTDIDVRSPRGLRVWRVARIFVYPNPDFFYDAALLVLSTPIHKPAIALATAADLAAWVPGTRAVTVGWGVTAYGHSLPGRITWGRVVIQSPGYCEAQARSLLGPTAGAAWTTGAQFCVRDPAGAIADCEGDSGGPLVVTSRTGAPIEIGIASFGSPGCSPRSPSFFARVDSVSTWLKQGIRAFARNATRR